VKSVTVVDGVLIRN